MTAGTEATASADEADRPVQPQRVLMPPQPSRWRVWLWLLLGLAIISPPLFVGLGEADTTRTMEKISLLSSQETWLRQHAEGGSEWLIPSWNSRPRVNKPPLTVWINMLAWTPLEPETASPQTLVTGARAMAAVFGLIAAAGAFWAGMSVGGIRVALMALIVTGTTILFTRQAQLASYDIHLMAFTTLAVAAGLWAMRPLKQTSPTSRRLIGWLVCGLALAAAILVKGFVAVPLAVAPLAVIVAIGPHRRLGNALGLLFALILGVLIAAPWFLYVIQVGPSVGLTNPMEALFQDYPLMYPDNPKQEQAQPFYYYLGLFALVFPWTIWLIGSLIQPWVRGRSERRQQLLLAWSWFVTVFVILSIPGAKQQRYLLPILPAMGVLVAQLWAFHIDLADGGRKDPGVNMLRVPHWIVIVGASLLFPIYLLFQNRIAAMLNEQFGEQVLRFDEFPGLEPWFIVLFGLALIAASGIGVWMHFRWRPRSAFAMMALWAVLFFSVVWYSYPRSYHGVNEYRDDAERVAATIDGRQLLWLNIDERSAEPNEEFLFYGRFIVQPVDREQLPDLFTHGVPIYVMAYDRPEEVSVLEDYRLQHVMDFRDDDDDYPPRVLYRWTPRPEAEL